MAKLAFLLVLVAVMFGAAGLATTTDSASATPGIPDGVKARIDLDCNQVIAPDDNVDYPGVGVVRCTLTIDIPDGWEPLLNDITLTIWAAYRDNDGNNRPSHGDRLLCIRVVGPAGGTILERCRDGIEIPDGLSLPDGA